jgi:hypothetical protein
LVGGQEPDLDSTKVEADAALDPLQPRFAVGAHLAALFAESAAEPPDEESGTDPPGGGAGADAFRPAPVPLAIALSREARADLAARSAARHDGIGGAGKPDRSETSGAHRRTAEVQDNQPALDLRWHARFRWKLRPRQVTGDTKHGTIDNVDAIERAGIRAYVPLSEVGHRPGLFPNTDFADDAGTDTCRCPGGETLRFLAECDATRRRIDEAPALACAACALRARCTTSPRGRRSAATWTRSTSSGCAATTPPSPSPGRCARARCGWSRGEPKPRTGTVCGASACGDCPRSTARRY